VAHNAEKIRAPTDPNQMTHMPLCSQKCPPKGRMHLISDNPSADDGQCEVSIANAYSQDQHFKDYQSRTEGLLTTKNRMQIAIMGASSADVVAGELKAPVNATAASNMALTMNDAPQTQRPRSWLRCKNTITTKPNIIRHWLSPVPTWSTQ
jgi:hypothetical protein